MWPVCEISPDHNDLSFHLIWMQEVRFTENPIPQISGNTQWNSEVLQTFSGHLFAPKLSLWSQIYAASSHGAWLPIRPDASRQAYLKFCSLWFCLGLVWGTRPSPQLPTVRAKACLQSKFRNNGSAAQHGEEGATSDTWLLSELPAQVQAYPQGAPIGCFTAISQPTITSKAQLPSLQWEELQPCLSCPGSKL